MKFMAKKGYMNELKFGLLHLVFLDEVYVWIISLQYAGSPCLCM